MADVHIISENHLDLESLEGIMEEGNTLELSSDSKNKIIECAAYLEKKMAESEEPLYGINTGFGSLHDKNISPDNLELLQANLVRSHACGTGPEIPESIVRMMLFLKIQSLSYGYSGVQLETVQRLIDLFNNGIHPVVFQIGSLGASGDLAPLAHLSLPLMGEGEVNYKGERRDSASVLKEMDWEPIRFKAKEGLALLNGTQMMASYGVYCLCHANKLLKLANTIGAITLDVFDGKIEPFMSLVHKIRAQQGQIKVAEEIHQLLKGSELMARPKKHVQDPYSFRCIPQVHGATQDTIRYVSESLLAEVNGVTDNPNIFPEEDLIISSGNFHGQPLALSMDFLAIALAELANISERRIFQMMTGVRGLPEYLAANPGLNSGLMIVQYTAAALVNSNKQLCTPASIDSITSSNGQEDHVSMGANSAIKLYQVVQNIYAVLAIELITASQAMEFRRPLKSSEKVEKLLSNFKKVVPFIDKDRILHDDMVNAEAFIRSVQLD